MTAAASTDRSRRLRLGLVLALVAGAAAFLVVKGLGDATTYFLNADEALEQRPELGTKRLRVQGTVITEAKPVGEDRVAFTIEFACQELDVRHTGEPPELFKRGIPVVLEGHFVEATPTFESDRIIVRHTSEYRTEEADRLELAEREAC